MTLPPSSPKPAKKPTTAKIARPQPTAGGSPKGPEATIGSLAHGCVFKSSKGRPRKGARRCPTGSNLSEHQVIVKLFWTPVRGGRCQQARGDFRWAVASPFGRFQRLREIDPVRHVPRKDKTESIFTFVIHGTSLSMKTRPSAGNARPTDPFHAVRSSCREPVRSRLPDCRERVPSCAPEQGILDACPPSSITSLPVGNDPGSGRRSS